MNTSAPLLIPSLFLFCVSFLSAGDIATVDSAERGPVLAAGISRQLSKGTQSVTGNGDVSLMWTGKAGEQDLFLGKADFWGVVRGNVTTAGRLRLVCDEVKGGQSAVFQNLGPATVTSKASRTNAVMESEAWIAYPENLVVIELSNKGSTPLHFRTELHDGVNSPLVAACRGTSESGCWMKVSPDLVPFDAGGRGFIGDIASLTIRSDEYPQGFLEWKPDDPSVRSGGAKISDDPVRGRMASFRGPGPAQMSLGNGCIPQKDFEWSSWIRPGTNTPDAPIFSGTAMARSQYPYYRGFRVHLVGGKPEARLNYYTATSAEPLPVEQWSEVKVTYRDQILRMSVNGREVARATNPPASEQMGWDKAVLRTGDPALPFSGCAPQAILQERVSGAQAEVKGQSLSFSIEPGKKARVQLSLVSDRNKTDYREAADALARSTDAEIDGFKQRHDAWWKSFWGKSFVEIPDRKVMENWYGSLYLLACCSRGDCPPPGLFYNFIRGMSVAWDGDYTLDYNYQAPFWAALAANHFELADNYDDLLLAHIERGRSIARNAWRIPSSSQPGSLAAYIAQRGMKPPQGGKGEFKGIYFYTHLIPLPGWSNDYGTFWGQKSNALFCAVNMIQRWRLTRDQAYARKVYPFLKATAEFWDDYLVLKDGRYVSLNDSICENSGPNTNPATTVSFIRLLYPSLIEISELLGQDEDRRGKWRDIAARMSPFTYIPASSLPFLKNAPAELVKDKFVIRDCESNGAEFPRSAYFTYKNRKITSSSAGMSCVQAIFPGWSFGIESDAKEREAALSTVTFAAQWYDFNNSCNFYADAAVAGYDPREILSNLDALIDVYEKSDFTITTPGGATEDVAIIPCALQNMFLQSHQRLIHLFPNWPADQDASFGDLPACGGFLVGSRKSHGKIDYVKVTSVRGGACRLANPWSGSTVKVSGSSAREISGPELEISMKAGETVVLTPAS